MKIKIYIVVFISTDDCTYCSHDYCDTFSTEDKAKDYISKQCKTTDPKWPPLHELKDFEIRTKILENPEVVT